MAGWAFVVGKTASCAAMALTFATYLVPDSPVAQRALSVAALAALTAINCRGITRTARVARLLLVVTLIVLVLAVVVILQTPGLSFGRLAGVEPVGAATSAYGVLQGPVYCLRLRWLRAHRRPSATRSPTRSGRSHAPSSSPSARRSRSS